MDDNQNYKLYSYNNWNQGHNAKPKIQDLNPKKISTAGNINSRGLTSRQQNTFSGNPNDSGRFAQGFKKTKVYLDTTSDVSPQKPKPVKVKSDSRTGAPTFSEEPVEAIEFRGDPKAQGRRTVTPGGTILKSYFEMRPHPFTGHNVFIEDVDDGDHKNHLCNTEYISDIMTYFRKTELKDAPNPDFMKLQPHINANMRAILHDWLIKVHDRFDLRPETIHLGLSLLDRFISTTKVGRTKYQLVGLTSLFLASKFEQIYPPDLKKFLFMANDEYTREQIIKMEILLLDRVNFHVQTPTSLTFLTRFAKVCQLDQEQTLFALYLCELSLLKVEFLSCLPSTIAAAACWLAMKILPFDDLDPEELLWSATLAHHTLHTEETIKECCVQLANLHRDASAQVLELPRWTQLPKAEKTEKTPSIFKKYCRSRYNRVALLAFPNCMGGMTSYTLEPNGLPNNEIVIHDRLGNRISSRPPVLLDVRTQSIPTWLKDADIIEAKRGSNRPTEIEYDPRGGSRYYDCDLMNDWDSVYTELA